MSYSKDAFFNITIGDKPFDADFPKFKDIIKEFLKSPIQKDIDDIPFINYSKFKEQFNSDGVPLLQRQFDFLVHPISDSFNDWVKIIEMGRLFHPRLTFIIIQLVHFLSRKFSLSIIDFRIGYPDHFTYLIRLYEGHFVFQTEEIKTDPVETDKDLMQLSQKDLIIMLEYFNSL
jgi:hypothetical protein